MHQLASDYLRARVRLGLCVSSLRGEERLASRVVLGEGPQAAVLLPLLAVPRPSVRGSRRRLRLGDTARGAEVEGSLADRSGWLSGVCRCELAVLSLFEKQSLPCSVLTDSSDDPSLQRSVSVATGLNMMKKQKVKTIFPHTAGANQSLLSFAQGDVLTLLVPEEKDGWLYGEHDTTKA